MTKKKELDKQELENVNGGEYGRQWNITGFRQDYTTNNTPVDSSIPNDTQFKPEDVSVYSDFMTSNKNQND